MVKRLILCPHCGCRIEITCPDESVRRLATVTSCSLCGHTLSIDFELGQVVSARHQRDGCIHEECRAPVGWRPP